MKRAVLFLLLNLTICAIYAQSQPVSQRLDALLNDEILKTSEVGITVFDLTTGESLYRYQDEKLYRPASIEKVITSVTALARLGADYTMDTHLRYTGKIENDTLKGNLYLIGGFDPELMDEDLDSLVAAVEAQVVPNIQVGNILGKSITIIAKGNMAGFVVGAQVPIVFCSRGSSAKEKFLSLALAAAVSAGKNK